MTFVAAGLVLWLAAGCQPDTDSAQKPVSTEVPVPERPVPAGFDVNDVSILFPVPSEANLDRHIWVYPHDDQPLLPMDLIKSFHYWLQPNDFQNHSIQDAVVVGMRFVPCMGAKHCVPEVRLIAQPSPKPDQVLDSAMHLIYALTDDQADAFAESLKALKRSSPVPTSGPLDIHPALQGDGMRGPFAKELKQLVLDTCVLERLSRIAVISSTREGFVFFAHFVEDGELGDVVPIPHTALATDGQMLRTEQPERLEIEGGGRTVADDDSLAFWLDSQNWQGQTVPQRHIDTLVRVANPDVHNRDTLDCVSCHVAEGLRHQAERAGLRQALRTSDEAFEAPPGVTAETAVQNGPVPDGIVHFGHAGTKLERFKHYLDHEGRGSVPRISQRTVAESARVAAWLNGHTSPRPQPPAESGPTQTTHPNGVVEVAISKFDGDCPTATCPPDAPYPVGCDIFWRIGNDYGCVASTTDSREVYFQDGKKCTTGFLIGSLFCSADPGTGMNPESCPMPPEKLDPYYVDLPEECPTR